MAVLTIRKLADRSSGTRVKRFDPVTGEPTLVNPETGMAEPWPFVGIQLSCLDGGAPDETTISTRMVANGIAEGWITGEGENVVHRPGGASNNKWAVTHTFVHYDRLTFDTVDGDVVYEVVKNPDKFVDSEDPEESVTDDHYESGNTRVDAFYVLKLVK